MSVLFRCRANSDPWCPVCGIRYYNYTVDAYTVQVETYTVVILE